MFAFNSRSGLHLDREKEDLLTSERSHFKPIVDKLDNRTQKQYADGATFVISNSLEKVINNFMAHINFYYFVENYLVVNQLFSSTGGF